MMSEDKREIDLSGKWWKFHVATIVTGLILGVILCGIKWIKGDFSFIWLSLIPMTPVFIYFWTFMLMFIYMAGGGLILWAPWKICKYIYDEFEKFQLGFDTDRSYKWSDYYFMVGVLTIAFLIVTIATLVMFAGVKSISKWW